MNVRTQPATLSPSIQSFLAFDVGQKRTGVAYASRLLGQAQPQGSVHASGNARWPWVSQHIARWQPDALVVGVPCHPDGAPHAMTEHALRFARQLQGRYALPVFTVDERYSTTEARESPAKDTDAAAACIILNQFLRGLST